MQPNPLAQPFAPPLLTTALGTKTTSHTNTNMLPNPSKAQSALPSLPTLSAFLLSHFAQLSPLAAAAEVPWLYHSPLPPRRQQQQTEPGTQPQQLPPRPLPANSGIKKLVLSITPTEGVYAALGASPLPPPLNHPSSDGITDPAPARATIPNNFKRPVGSREKFTTAAFLHRPWSLTRGRLPHGTTVWTSHKAFDESLTTGYNLALLERLGANVKDPKVLVGYKGDQGRRIGVVAGFGETDNGQLEIDDVKGRIIAQFGDLRGEGAWFGFDETSHKGINEDTALPDEEVKKPNKITSIACMNAFHPAEVDRVAAAALEAGLITSLDDCSGLLYLTGAVREEGLEAALQKGMKVVCVGHRLCEVWGIAYLAEKVKERWPEVEVRVVDEEEVKPPPKEKKEVKAIVPGKKKTVKVKSKPKPEALNGVSENEAMSMLKRRRTNSEGKDEDGGVSLLS
jgi:putative NIF3 family GTP cyclohydrolase 1 type 2